MKHSVTITINADVVIEIDADNLDDAIQKGAEIKLNDILKASVEVMDGHKEVTGVWRNDTLV